LAGEDTGKADVSCQVCLMVYWEILVKSALYQWRRGVAPSFF